MHSFPRRVLWKRQRWYSTTRYVALLTRWVRERYYLTPYKRCSFLSETEFPLNIDLRWLRPLYTMILSKGTLKIDEVIQDLLHWSYQHRKHLKDRLQAASHIYHFYTGCPRRNVPDFERVFLMLKYTDITQNTYVQRWTVGEIMAREKCGLHRCRRTLRRPWRHTCPMRLPENETWQCSDLDVCATAR